ncbi:MAG: hypothetical protein ACIALR_04485, partial [Blastopirellula sp. JB062]
MENMSAQQPMRCDTTPDTGRLKIGFNANLLSVPAMRGWNRYAVNLLEQLPAVDLQLTLYSMEPIAESFRC